MKVKCPSCCEIYLETTEDFDPDKIASGTMFQLTEKYGPKGYNWSPNFGPYDMAEGICCPGCGSPIVNLDGKVDRGNLIEGGISPVGQALLDATKITDLYEKARAEKERIQPTSAYVCEECGKLCKNAFGLNAHMRTHNKEVK